MTDNERELLNIIRGSHNPSCAIKIAFDLMIDFLAKHGVPQGTSSAHRQESA